MASIAVTAENFDSLTDQDGIVLIDWWVDCPPSNAFAPVFEESSGRHPDVRFLRINVEEHEELAMEFMVQHIPTLMVFRDRIMVFVQPGAVAGGALDELIKQVKALDMEEVKAELEKAEAEDHDHSGCDHDHDHGHHHHDHDHDHDHGDGGGSKLLGPDGKPLIIPG